MHDTEHGISLKCQVIFLLQPSYIHEQDTKTACAFCNESPLNILSMLHYTVYLYIIYFIIVFLE